MNDIDMWNFISVIVRGLLAFSGVPGVCPLIVVLWRYRLPNSSGLGAHREHTVHVFARRVPHDWLHAAA